MQGADRKGPPRLTQQRWQVEANGGTLEELQLGPQLTFDNGTEQFTGDHCAKANALLRPKMRKEFEIPDAV